MEQIKDLQRTGQMFAYMMLSNMVRLAELEKETAEPRTCPGKRSLLRFYKQRQESIEKTFASMKFEAA